MQVTCEGKGQRLLCAIPNSRRCTSLLSVWPVRGIKKLKWHICNALLSLFSATCKHQLMPWWLECGKFGSGRGKAARGSSQSGGKKKKLKTDSLECSQSLEWTVSLPSLSEVPYFSPPLSYFTYSLTCFSFSPLFSQWYAALLFPLPSYFPPHSAYVSQYLLTVHQWLNVSSWIISDLLPSPRQTHFLNKGKVGSQVNAR